MPIIENPDQSRKRGARDRRFDLAVLAALCLLAAAPVAGQSSLSEHDFAELPSYCKFANGMPEHGNATMVAHWQAIIGPTFAHIHHYCRGLVDVNHAKFLDKDEVQRKHDFGASVREFQYIIDRAPADFVLLPEIYTKQGESLMALGSTGPAVTVFTRAIELKKDYWPPYADLADFYKGVGKPEEARQWLERGLQLIPDAEALKRRLNELDRVKNQR